MNQIFTIDSIVSLIAPHQCMACGREGSVLCDICLLSAGDPVPSRCAGCKKLTKDYRTCTSCKSWLNCYSVTVAANYSGIYEGLIKAYKFQHKRQAASTIAKLMSDSIIIPDNSLICIVPTAPSRARERGFDHAVLLGRHIASKHDKKLSNVLRRRSNKRQLGSTRAQRMNQMTDEFYTQTKANVKGRNIVLIDDVMTTGASLSAAAKVLKKAGAKRVYASIFTQSTS